MFQQRLGWSFSCVNAVKILVGMCSFFTTSLLDQRPQFALALAQTLPNQFSNSSSLIDDIYEPSAPALTPSSLHLSAQIQSIDNHVFDDFISNYSMDFSGDDVDDLKIPNPEQWFKEKVLPQINISSSQASILWVSACLFNSIDLAKALLENGISPVATSASAEPPIVYAKLYQRRDILDLLSIPFSEQALTLREAESIEKSSHQYFMMVEQQDDLPFNKKRALLDFYWKQLNLTHVFELYKPIGKKPDPITLLLAAKYGILKWFDVLLPNEFTSIKEDPSLDLIFSSALATAHYARRIETLEYLLTYKYKGQAFTSLHASKALHDYITKYMLHLKKMPVNIDSFRESEVPWINYLFARLGASSEVQLSYESQQHPLTPPLLLLTTALPGQYQHYIIHRSNMPILYELMKTFLAAGADVNANGELAIVDSSFDATAKKIFKEALDKRILPPRFKSEAAFFLNSLYHYPIHATIFFLSVPAAALLAYLTYQEFSHRLFPPFINFTGFSPYRSIDFSASFLRSSAFFLLPAVLESAGESLGWLPLNNTDPLRGPINTFLYLSFHLIRLGLQAPWNHYVFIRLAYAHAQKSLPALRTDTQEPWDLLLYATPFLPSRYLSFDLAFVRDLTPIEIDAHVTAETLQRYYQALVPDQRILVEIAQQQVRLLLNRTAFLDRQARPVADNILTWPDIMTFIELVFMPPKPHYNFELYITDAPALAVPIGPFVNTLPVKRKSERASPTVNSQPKFDAFQILEEQLHQFKTHKDFSEVFKAFERALTVVETHPENLGRFNRLRENVALVYLQAIYSLSLIELSDQKYAQTMLEIAERIGNQKDFKSLDLYLLVQLKAALAQNQALPIIFEYLDHLKGVNSMEAFKLKPELQQMAFDYCIEEAARLFKQLPEQQADFDTLLDKAIDLASAAHSKVNLYEFLIKLIKHYCERLQKIIAPLPLLHAQPQEALDLSTKISKYSAVFETYPSKMQEAQKAQESLNRMLRMRERILTDAQDSIHQLADSTLGITKQLRNNEINLGTATSLLATAYQKVLIIKRQLWGDAVALHDFDYEQFISTAQWALVKKLQTIMARKEEIDQLAERRFTSFLNYVENLNAVLHAPSVDAQEAWRLWDLIQDLKNYLGTLIDTDLEQQCEALKSKLPVTLATLFVDTSTKASISHVSESRIESASSASAAEPQPSLTYDEILACVNNELTHLYRLSETDSSELMRASLHFSLIRWFETLLNTNLITAARTYASDMRNYLAHPQGDFNFTKLQELSKFIIENKLAYCEGFADRPRIHKGLQDLFEKGYFSEFVSAAIAPEKQFTNLLNSLVRCGHDILNLRYAQSGTGLNSQMVGAAAYAVMYWYDAFAKQNNDALHSQFSIAFSKLPRFRNVRNQLAHQTQMGLRETAEIILSIAHSKHFETLIHDLANMAIEVSINPSLFYALCDNKSSPHSDTSIHSPSAAFSAASGITAIIFNSPKHKTTSHKSLAKR